MPAPAYLTPDYMAAMQALLPRGRAWPRDPSATQTAVLTGLAKRYEASNADANTLLVEAFPATAGEMLPEWEAALGLPGIYGVMPGTTAGRRAAVVAALTDTGGQSKAYFIALAAALGFAITITEFLPFNVNSPVGTAISGDDWASVWQVNASAAIASSYTVTADVVPTAPGFGNPLLDAVLGKYKPAHTIVITSYT